MNIHRSSINQMAGTSSDNDTNGSFFLEKIEHFPPVIDGRINAVQFLKAAMDLVAIVERLGKIFAPVKYDMQGNIDKIKKFYDYNENSCLLELMLNETSKGKPGIESVLWLNRAMLFCELLFQEIINCLQDNTQVTQDISMKKLFTVAYEGSVKKYHNWVSQQIFTFICKMSPTLLQLLKYLDCDDVNTSLKTMTTYNIKLHIVRWKIDDFLNEHNLVEHVCKDDKMTIT